MTGWIDAQVDHSSGRVKIVGARTGLPGLSPNIEKMIGLSYDCSDEKRATAWKGKGPYEWCIPLSEENYLIEPFDAEMMAIKIRDQSTGKDFQYSMPAARR